MSKRQVTNYTEEFKQSSAKLAIDSEQSVSKTAKELGVNATTLHGWVQKYYATHQGLPAKSNDAEAEIKRLKKVLQRVTMERDILKKAAAYFANDAL